jgi:hypothetical protein
MPGYPFDVFHHLIGMGKHMIVYPLMGIPDPDPPLIPPGYEGIVDVPFAQRGHSLKRSVNRELVYYAPQTSRRIVHVNLILTPIFRIDHNNNGNIPGQLCNFTLFLYHV